MVNEPRCPGSGCTQRYDNYLGVHETWNEHSSGCPYVWDEENQKWMKRITIRSEFVFEPIPGLSEEAQRDRIKQAFDVLHETMQNSGRWEQHQVGEWKWVDGL